MATFLPIVIAPQPPTEWMRIETESFGEQVDVLTVGSRASSPRCGYASNSCSCQIWSFGR